MKRLVAAILLTFVLFSFTACDFSNDSPEESESSITTDIEESITQDIYNNSDENKAVQSVADFSSYESIIETFKSIVNCFPEYTTEQYLTKEHVSTLTFPNEETRDIYDMIFREAYRYYLGDYTNQYLDDGRNYFGYALYDINKNGSDELILMNDHYEIVTIFTNSGGTPRMIIEPRDYFSIGGIDDQGRIYTSETVLIDYEYLSHYIYTVYDFTESDELIVADEYTAKDFDSKEDPINTQYSLDLNFVRLFNPIYPYLFYRDCWIWYRDRSSRESIIEIFSITETDVTINFCSDSVSHKINYVKATREGESAYFELETLSGRLEFGLDCIWIVINKSNIEEIPCGAYIYEYYEYYKKGQMPSDDK